MSFLPRKPHGPAEINLMPMADFFVALTTFLLLGSTFIGLSYLPTPIVRPATLANSPVKHEYAIVTISDEGRLLLTSHDDVEIVRIPARRQLGYDWDGFSRAMERIPPRFQEIVLLPTRQTSYQTLVRLTEIAKKNSRTVVLSGEAQP